MDMDQTQIEQSTDEPEPDRPTLVERVEALERQVDHMRIELAALTAPRAGKE